MSRLFVDVDGTLLCWQKAAECDHAVHLAWSDKRHWKPDEKVIAYAKQWRADNPDGVLIVWSGEGMSYALRWGLLLGMPFEAMDKHFLTPAEGDVFIDDYPAPPWGAHAIHPKDLP